MSPFLGDNDMETVNNIASGEFEYPDPDPEEGFEDISDLAKGFIESMLVPSSGWAYNDVQGFVGSLQQECSYLFN